MNSTDGNIVEVPFALKIVLRLFYVLVFIVGLFGNLLVCIVIVQQRRMRTVINYFTLNLALSDLIFIVIYLPSQLAAFENNQNWLLGNTGCRIIYSIAPVCLTTSIATLLAISCERFRGIVYPFQPRLRVATVRKIILLIWLVSLATAMPLMFVAGTIRKDENVFCDEKWPSTISSKFYWISMFLLQYVIPLFVMIVLYGVAGWKLQRRISFGSRSFNVRHATINSAAESARQQQSQKITKMLVALILLYSFCMLPQHVVYFWITYGNFLDWEYSLYVFRISNLFPMANSALNSIAYGTLQADFRRAYKKFFKRYKLCLCTESCQSTTADGRRIKRFNNAAIRKKSSNKEKLENKFMPINSSEAKVEQTGMSMPTFKTTLQRVSSDSRSYLISGESTNTSESQASKQGDLEIQKFTQENGPPLSKGVERSLREIKETNGEQSVDVETCAQVFINKDTHDRHRSNNDTIDDSFLFDINIEIGDIVSFQTAKETSL